MTPGELHDKIEASRSTPEYCELVQRRDALKAHRQRIVMNERVPGDIIPLEHIDLQLAQVRKHIQNYVDAAQRTVLTC